MAFIPTLATQVAVLCFLCLCLWTCAAGRTNHAYPLQMGGGEIISRTLERCNDSSFVGKYCLLGNKVFGRQQNVLEKFQLQLEAPKCRLYYMYNSFEMNILVYLQLKM